MIYFQNYFLYPYTYIAKISNIVTKLLGTLKSKTQSLFKSKKRDTNVMSKQKQNQSKNKTLNKSKTNSKSK